MRNGVTNRLTRPRRHLGVAALGLVLACSFSLAAQAETAAHDPLFASHEPLSITLKGPFKDIDKQRDKTAEYAPGSLSYDGPDGTVSIETTYRPRGNFRLDKQTCSRAQLWLDLRPVGEAKLTKQFPTILGRCRELGLDPMQMPLPVAPAAHYWMGGIATDLDAATSLPGLYAVGEVASSGVHGANRLASNSLSECLVMASQLSRLQPPANAMAASGSCQRRPLEWAPPEDLQGPCGAPITALRQWSWKAAGVERSGRQLQGALEQCEQLGEQLNLERALAPILQLEPDQSRSLSSSQEQQQVEVQLLVVMPDQVVVE